MNFFRRGVRRLFSEMRLFFPFFQKCDESNTIIVSLTSYPARLRSLHLVIRSLLRQSLCPKKIVLYLGDDTPIDAIPASLKKFEKYGLEIKTGYEDLKPHKKYYYAMQEYPDNIIITVDDDLIYDKNLVRDLYETFQKYPDCVCARRVHKITKISGMEIASYNDWNWECTNIMTPSHELFATGVGGVLYPPHVLPTETFDSKSIKALCLNTDDVWLKFMELKNGIKVVWTDSDIVHPLTLRHTQQSALMAVNTSGENRNDINIRKMQEYTGINLADYVK